ncbi:MAG: hypothetical protein QOF76_1698 [Solirubrobacteraceae bacterium]|jgi:CBS domain-containing protein|nr:hypothetical protein [Solirubrobacteraceae bacterium]
MGTKHIPTEEAGPTVRDVMLADPTSVAPDATVADARKIFESPRQKLLMVCDGNTFVTAVRADAIAGADDATPLRELDSAVPVLAPEDSTDRVFQILDGGGLNRIPVVDGDGELLGLVCFNQTKNAFCVS